MYECLGFCASITNRVPLGQLEHTTNGHVTRKISDEDQLNQPLKSWDLMPDKYFRWVVVSREVTPPAQIMEYHRQAPEEHEKEMAKIGRQED